MLRWYGHVCQMHDTGLPSKVLYGQVRIEVLLLDPESEHLNVVLLCDPHILKLDVLEVTLN